MRRQLLAAGAELPGRGLLERADDIMFLDLREALAAADGADLRASWSPPAGPSYERETAAPAASPGCCSPTGRSRRRWPRGPPLADGTLVGMAAAPGMATGRARVILDPAGAHVEPGEILVAPTTDPGWTPLFLTAAGLVTETGSPMAHGPTVAREYGIPAVICVRDATQLITTGQLITIDGAAGHRRRRRRPDHLNGLRRPRSPRTGARRMPSRTIGGADRDRCGSVPSVRSDPSALMGLSFPVLAHVGKLRAESGIAGF